MKQALKKISLLFLNSAERKELRKSTNQIFISSCEGDNARQTNTTKQQPFYWEIISTELILRIKTNRE